jgi:hypothetical protein
MLKSYVIAVLAISGLMVIWAFVQRIWSRVFFPASPDLDVLEHRRSCGSCGCAHPCARGDRETREAGRVSIEDRPSQ